MSKQLIIYTREPNKDIYYDPKLAHSMHLAYVENGCAIAFNHNSGVLFAKATENEDGSLNPKGLIEPYVFQMENGEYGILAKRIDEDIHDDAENPEKQNNLASEALNTEELLLVTTKDFIHYIEQGMTSEYNDLYAQRTMQATDRENTPSNAQKSNCEVTANDINAPVDLSKIEGIIFAQIIDIPDEKMDYLKKKLCPMKVENWTGPIFDNPIAINRADPDVYLYNGMYYYIATNDADNNHTLYVRAAKKLEDIPTAPEHLILDSDTYDDIKGLLWAPEFHEINGKLYIFHAATREEFFAEESRLMELKDGGNPLVASDWSKPRRIVRMDGSELCEEGKEISLDMTEFEWEGEYYVIWSQRQFLPKDLGAWLYIAKLNPDNPWMLASEPIVLSKPDYGWGNNHTFVEEGPFALVNDDVLYITFSAAAVDESYVVSYLSIGKGVDLLNPKNWWKNNYPILTSRSVQGEYGTGHNAYVIDPEGRVWNTYHARFGATAPRSSAIRQVFFDVDGAPVLDVVL